LESMQVGPLGWPLKLGQRTIRRVSARCAHDSHLFSI
jgi:hypothetical protein